MEQIINQTVSPVTAPKMLDFLKQGWEFATRRMDLIGWYVGLLIIFTVLSSEWIMMMDNIVTFVAVLMALMVLVFITINSWGILYATAQPDPVAVTYKQAFDWAAKHFFPLIWTSILAGVATLLGFFLFVIPGIILSIYLQFAIYAVAMGNDYGVSALTRSYQDVKGRWWTVVGRLFILGFWLLLIYLAIGLVFGAAFITSGDDDLTMMVFEALIAGAGGVISVMTMYAIAQYYKYLRAHPIQQEQIIDKKSTT